jgi:hypothetical protein
MFYLHIHLGTEITSLFISSTLPDEDIKEAISDGVDEIGFIR